MNTTIADLKNKAKYIEISVRIGKQGLSESVLNEINTQLKKHKLIKIRILKAAMGTLSREEIVKKIISFTGAEVMSFIGFVVCIYRK